MASFQEPGACDCHSHVFGPYRRFPLSPSRTFDPPESTIFDLAQVWSSLGVHRAVLIQGSAHGKDPSALLHALLLSPDTRRGVVLLDCNVSEERVASLHACGVRAIRFNWIRHLLGSDTRTPQQRLAEATQLVRRIAQFGWHIELHIDIGDLDLAMEVAAPDNMPVVIDHMARIDMSGLESHAHITRLLRLLENERFWVKVSGADRLSARSEELSVARSAMQALLRSAPDRCVWGLDWPHVNLSRKRTDPELADLLQDAAGDEQTLRKVLVTNPARLYGFETATA